MKYANTTMQDGAEVVVTVLPLNIVPGFDPENPPQDNTYGVDDDVQAGWVKQPDGSFAAPPPPEVLPPPIPTVVTMRQARLALLQSGLLATVNAAVAGADEPTKIAWEFSSEVQRSNPLVATLTAALSLTSEQLDDLFTLAATL